MLDTDEKTFEKLFREHYSLLCNYANSIVCNEQAVEDIVQNFFIAVLGEETLIYNGGYFSSVCLSCYQEQLYQLL